ALQEMLCQKIKTGQEQQALDFALASPTSIASVSLSGSIDSCINLRNPEKLQSFVDCIKGFTIPDHLIKTSKEIGLPSPQLIQNVTKLLDSLLDTNWRSWPMQLDVPHTCQIFGQIVAETGIEGILYPSKFNERDCLAIFPQNFEEDGSYVQLDDEAPAETRVDRLDAQSWAKIQRMKV
ncbi:MAG: RES family NAD+ phosphorylase, partial [Candidatus Brocadiales bacterium]|nr:RES family NAD+ phosphorylase [Candidatus Bathyanammoxibius sp.]